MWKYIWIVIIIVFIYLIKRWRNKKGTVDVDNSAENFYAINDNQYKEYIYRSTQNDFQPYLKQLFDKIDEIITLTDANAKELSSAGYNAMLDIMRKADEVERIISEYWRSNRFNCDFSYYIGLHYASHLLGNAIKKEQQIVKESFVECKKNQKIWGDRIDFLKRRQQQLKGKDRAEVGQEISSCCTKHKQLSMLSSQLGGINTSYNQRVTQQHIETGKRRDYIAANFGERGRNWKERIEQRKLKKRDQL